MLKLNHQEMLAEFLYFELTDVENNLKIYE